METYSDEKTAARVAMLPHDGAKDDRFYQTHHRFAPNMEFAVFNSAGINTHPHPSFTPDRKAVVLNSSKNAKADIFVVGLPAQVSLPLPEEINNAA
ncbi:MAG: oligogalacturonate lyase family protein [Candidatus Hydrogenedentes bacterium]|nr:oligogalacturonate lyase family protein [Candidatus Hydrogenedentota bacterium]